MTEPSNNKCPCVQFTWGQVVGDATHYGDLHLPVSQLCVAPVAHTTNTAWQSAPSDINNRPLILACGRPGLNETGSLPDVKLRSLTPDFFPMHFFLAFLPFLTISFGSLSALPASSLTFFPQFSSTSTTTITWCWNVMTSMVAIWSHAQISHQYRITVTTGLLIGELRKRRTLN